MVNQQLEKPWLYFEFLSTDQLFSSRNVHSIVNRKVDGSNPSLDAFRRSFLFLKN